MHKALFIQEAGKHPPVTLQSVTTGDLPAGDLLVDVLWSSLNYKDALALTGTAPIVRAPFPFIPGIDLIGRVRESTSSDYCEGDLVIQTGWGLGENHFGGYTQLARLNANHVIRLPEGLSPRAAMVIGTAGFTAMLACLALEHHGLADGPVVVTGASGGVGSLSILFLHRMGHQVVASSGSADPEYLRDLGASEVIGRDVLAGGAARPLDSARWGGAIDSVGGRTLEALISQTGTRGAVAACGLAGGSGLNTTVFPFILRGVGLLGIDSNTCPQSLREDAWSRIADVVDDSLLNLVAHEITLAELPAQAARLLAGRTRGRTVVRCSE